MLTNKELNNLCGPNDDIINKYKRLVSKEDVENLSKFLENLDQIILANKLFTKTQFNKNDEDALLFSCNNEKYDVALAIVNSGKANLKTTNARGFTPLMLCAASEHPMSYNVAVELLKGDCNPAQKNDKGRNSLIQCCVYRTIPSFKIGIELLDKNVEEQQFVLDKFNVGGLDYLLDFEYEDDDENETNFPVEYYIEIPEYVAFVIKYLKLYFDTNPADEIYLRNIEKICNNETLKRGLRSGLNRVGINLYDVCKPIKDAGIAMPLKGSNNTLGLKIPEKLEKASKVSLALAVPAEGVSPGGRWVRPEDEHYYQQQEHNFEDIRRYKRENPSPSGGKRRTKRKLQKIKRRNTKKQKK